MLYKDLYGASMKFLGTSFIFDLDGTLIDSTADICEAMNLVRKNYGFNPLSLDEYAQLIGLPAITLLSDINVDYDFKVQLLREFRLTLRNLIQKRVTLFPGVFDLIQKLSLLQIRLGIATSKPTDMATFTISHSKLAKFVFIVQGTDDFEAKPNPEVILRCMKQMNGDQFVMFGDRVEDMQAARLAGIRAVGIAQTTHNQEQLKEAGANITFESITHMLPEIDSLLARSFDNL